MAAKDKARFEKENHADDKKKPAAQSKSDAKKEKAAAEAGGPKKALTAYFLFLAEKREEFKKMDPIPSMIEQTKQAS